jgi:Uma2 family endonuclease
MIAANLPLPLSLGAESNGMEMTAAEFDSIEDWDETWRYELINGVVVVNPPPGMFERSPNDFLGYLLHAYRLGHPQGSLLDWTAFEQTLVFGENRQRCDRAIWIGLGRKPNEAVDFPAIIVEFPGNRSRDRNRDYVVKRQEYLAAGAQEYWIIDLRRREMTIFLHDGSSQTIAAGETYRTDLLPGFELPLDQLVERAEGYE